MREALNQGGTPIDDALQRARAAAAGPVVLFDVGDNVFFGAEVEHFLRFSNAADQ